MEIKSGKLPAPLLQKLLSKIKHVDPRVLVGPKLGEDAALIEFGDKILAAKTDPITFATDLIGWYLVQVNTNDLAVVGATPRWMLVTLLLPEGTNEQQITSIFSDLTKAAKSQNIALIGGHTEITSGITRSIAIGTLLGELDSKDAIKTADIKDGDAIILTKGIAIEGTSLLCRENENKLLELGVNPNIINTGKKMLFEPGISVRTDAELARKTVKVNSMHDPTEGGIATGLEEMASASGLGFNIDSSNIVIYKESKIVCDALGLNPLGLISSGALLLTTSADNAPKLLSAFHKNNIIANIIGTATKQHKGVNVLKDGTVSIMESFDRDELARYYDDNTISHQ
ncbi:MAG: hydrogenase expression/formation protein [SAR202 cluster bacterium]|nr:hydrogenase expression/formation protein [SAR202 cluster bacterium]|tara:strand:- start:43670 stop:44698 length:1029 start_codon:yes stop_codon:yes gene_type:complete